MQLDPLQHTWTLPNFSTRKQCEARRAAAAPSDAPKTKTLPCFHLQLMLCIDRVLRHLDRATSTTTGIRRNQRPLRRTQIPPSCAPEYLIHARPGPFNASEQNQLR